MFLEPTHAPGPLGWIEVVCGSMFSGKTEELMRRLRRAQYARLATVVLKHALDTRFDAEAPYPPDQGSAQAFLMSHDRNHIPSRPVSTAAEVLALGQHYQVVGIDEAQFFDQAIVDAANALADAGKRVIIAGLDMDYLGQPFGPMPQLMATAEYVTKLHAICARTGHMAHYSHRKSRLEGQLMLGEKDHYEPLARPAFRDALREDSESTPPETSSPTTEAKG